MKLLPCPFCGTESDAPHGPKYAKNGDMWEGAMHDVCCQECMLTISDYSREKVEGKWNTRLTSSRDVQDTDAEIK